MPSRFTDARELMSDLLDRYETGTASPISYPDYSGFPDVVAIDKFAEELREAEAAGAVRIANGKGRNGDQIAHVRLQAAARMYAFLERRPIAELVDEATGRLLSGFDLPAEFESSVASLRAAWTRGFALDDVDRLRTAFVLAKAILEGRHRGADYRTFSRRIAGAGVTAYADIRHWQHNRRCNRSPERSPAMCLSSIGRTLIRMGRGSSVRSSGSSRGH